MLLLLHWGGDMLCWRNPCSLWLLSALALSLSDDALARPSYSGRPASALAIRLLSVPALEVRQLPLPLTLQLFCYCQSLPGFCLAPLLD